MSAVATGRGSVARRALGWATSVHDRGLSMRVIQAWACGAGAGWLVGGRSFSALAASPMQQTCFSRGIVEPGGGVLGVRRRLDTVERVKLHGIVVTSCLGGGGGGGGRHMTATSEREDTAAAAGDRAVAEKHEQDAVDGDDDYVDPLEYGLLSDVRAELAEVLELLEEKKASDIVVFDSQELPVMKQMCERMIIATGRTKKHMGVIAQHVVEHYKLKGMLLESEEEGGGAAPSAEGMDSDLWTLIDLGDTLVHIFSEEGRDHYKLEQHWREMEEARKADVPYHEYLDRKQAAAIGMDYEAYLAQKPLFSPSVDPPSYY
jgi:ribosome-associated protein